MALQRVLFHSFAFREYLAHSCQLKGKGGDVQLQCFPQSSLERIIPGSGLFGISCSTWYHIYSVVNGLVCNISVEIKFMSYKLGLAFSEEYGNKINVLHIERRRQLL